MDFINCANICCNCKGIFFKIKNNKELSEKWHRRGHRRDFLAMISIEKELANSLDYRKASVYSSAMASLNLKEQK